MSKLKFSLLIIFISIVVLGGAAALVKAQTSPSLYGVISYADLSTKTGEVYFNWNAVSGALSYEIWRADNAGMNGAVFRYQGQPGGNYFFYDTNVPFGAYYYQLKVIMPNGTEQLSSAVPINLNIAGVFEGIAWSGLVDSQNNQTGTGWIKFNSRPVNNSPSSPANYSVQVDDQNKLSGAAWSPNYGWLSFNEADLANCPDVNGACFAAYDPSTGDLSGWARFIGGQNDSTGQWGWVHLQGSNYGVKADPGTGSLSGVAWGGPAIGWIGFGAPECQDCSVVLKTVQQPAPANGNFLEAKIFYVNDVARTADVYLSLDYASVPEKAATDRIERSTNPAFDPYDITVVNDNLDTDQAVITGRDRNVPIGETVYYRLRYGNGPRYKYSNSAEVNLDIAYVLKGVAWSAHGNAGIGWVKFNSASENGSPASAFKYSVNIDRNGLMSGVAWSPNYGWLSFNQSDLAGCPVEPCEASVDLSNPGNSTAAVRGWAKFINFDDPAQAYWERLTGVKLNFRTNKFKDASWGGDASSAVAGWLAWNSDHGAPLTGPECQNCTVRVKALNQKPVVSNITITPTDLKNSIWCQSTPYYLIEWRYNDSDNDRQQRFELEIIDASTGQVVKRVSQSTSNSSYKYSDPLGYEANKKYNQPGYLKTSTNYKIRVRAYDGNLWSDWVYYKLGNNDFFTTPSHYLPLVDYSWSPQPAVTKETTVFTSNVTNRSTIYTLDEFAWSFGEATPTQKINNGPDDVSVVFINLPSQTSLRVTDSSGAACITSQEVTGTNQQNPKKRQFFEK